MAFANPIALMRELTPVQRRTFVAAFLGWTLDAFDFFLVVFVISAIARDFHLSIVSTGFAITITLLLRPLGALIFGVVADRYGRRGPLMINIVVYSAVELASGFAPNFTVFLILRSIYGIAMGGEWGIGAALALESLPAHARGAFSGILQQGYAVGYLLAAVAYYAVFPHFGWRGMFVAGVLPALLVLYIRSYVPESEVWRERARRPKAKRENLASSFGRQPWLYLYAIALMAAFNFMSHGSQDLYPTFLEKQRGFDVGTVALVTIVANLGAIAGGSLFGALSQTLGRRRTIATSALVGILAIPLWAFAPSAALLAVGAFVMQFFVQGAWGVVPVHLNELSPGDVRATFPGLTYQLGNLIVSGALQFEAAFAATMRTPSGGENYARALAIIMCGVFVTVAVLALVGPERRGVAFADD